MQVGAEWRELSEERVRQYEAALAAKKRQHEAATEAFEAALEQWERQKELAAAP